jgi:hypothetical protein
VYINPEMQQQIAQVLFLSLLVVWAVEQEVVERLS